MAQGLPLPSSWPAISTQVIARPRDFDKLFDGFSALRGISFVSSARLVLDLLDKRGFEQVELLVGDSLAGEKGLKEELTGGNLGLVERLASEVETGRLRLHVPPRMVHTKLFLLSGSGRLRAIVTSANLTESARRASGQVNYALYVDGHPEDPFMQRVHQDFDTQCEGSSLFMGDLLDLFQRRTDLSREEIVKVWLGMESGEDADSAQVRAVMQDMVAEVFAHPGEEERPIINVHLPSAPGPRRQLRRLLEPLGIGEGEGGSRVSPMQLIRYVQQHYGVPLMRVSHSRDALWLGFRGIDRVDQPLGTAEEVDAALQGVEDYVETVNLGECADRTFAKTSMYEALLYVLSSPFANEQMRERRRLYGSVNRRGPKYLYLYGPAQNGKTTFLRYALKLITGDLVEPFSADWFTKTRIRGVYTTGTCFPLMFDDLGSPTSKTFEDVAKSHWEAYWSEDVIFPQLVFTSNAMNLREWAKSRLKRIDFDVHFVPTTENQRRLAEILERPNPIFRWFAWLYLQQVRQGDWLQDDEMATARKSMRDLYHHAGRTIPDYFPERPLEEIYDPDLRVWKELQRHRKVRLQSHGGELTAHFSDDVEHPEIREYLAALPQTVKHRQRGKTTVIDNPDVFVHWLEGRRHRRSWWRRMLGLR